MDSSLDDLVQPRPDRRAARRHGVVVVPVGDAVGVAVGDSVGDAVGDAEDVVGVGDGDDVVGVVVGEADEDEDEGAGLDGLAGGEELWP